MSVSTSGVAKPIKKLLVIFLSFISAIALLSVTNLIVAHIFVASSLLFQQPQPQATVPPSNTQNGVQPNNPPGKKKKKKKKKKAPEPKVETKIVYVSPTKEDLNRIRRELETSDPLPPASSESVHNDYEDNQRSASRVQLIVAATEQLMKQQQEQSDASQAALQTEMHELLESHAAFLQRFEHDTSSKPVMVEEDLALHFQDQLAFLRSVLGRTSLKDLSREDVRGMLNVAMEDLAWLLEPLVDEEDEEGLQFLSNANDTLLMALVEEDVAKAEVADTEAASTCPPSFLALDEGAPSAEFTPPTIKKSAAKKKQKVARETAPKQPSSVAPTIDNDTARESQLYDLVETIKHILSRRELSSLKLGESDPLPHPMDDRSVAQLRGELIPMVTTLAKKWDSVLNNERNIRNYWEGRFQYLMEEISSRHAIRDEYSSGMGSGMCAPPPLIEGMIRGGFESLRRKGVLRSQLVHAAYTSMADDPERVLALSEEMKRVVVEEVFEDEGEGGRISPLEPEPSQRGESSSWKVGRKSIHYAVDGPLLHRGFVGWIDSFVDAISGYNDHVDSFVDWIIGEEGVSVGTTLANLLGRGVRKLPLDDEYAERIKRSGILSGRARVVLEEK
eukprot:CAMPEP_0183728574 /NCGR_PEP_ID=MMETSP0737-20130205/28400_1 /TAXON_ID=385413 /ORGANISM="Thalassiosira miniscula, Strain CCMP1093" /LENGTH=617 /DNA_ID=CAMNT_0025960561 /DNA_START=38 /DNA_END=1891 /DNA_ORIENTATION=-